MPPEGRLSITALQETVESLRTELNEAKNAGATKAELEAICADIQTKLDQLAAAKAKPATEPGNGKEKTPAPTVTGDQPRARFGFW